MSLSAAADERFSERVERTDQQLVELVLNGDEHAFEELFDRHKLRVTRIAAKYLRRAELVEDAVQVTFAKMYHELSGFRGTHESSLAGWISKIAANTCLDVLRSQKRRPDETLSEADDEAMRNIVCSRATGEKLAIDRDLAGKLLSRLSAEDRVLLQMLYVAEQSVNEAAAALGWSAAKTKLRAWRARNQLRKIARKLL